MHRMATLRLFASAREAAGTGSTQIDAATVGDVLEDASTTFGPDFRAVLQSCRVWLNGEPAELHMAVTAGDEVAVLPPVSGGCV
jgi:molybdopterin converting factor small subunit